jgi:hypothetical protein
MKKSEFFLKRENEIVERLKTDGYFWVNYTSTDCDGCYAQQSIKMTSLEELYAAEEDAAEWADGPFSYSLAEKDETGAWELLENFRGGSW